MGIKDANNVQLVIVRRVYEATVVQHGLRRAKYLDTSFPKHYRRRFHAPLVLFPAIYRGNDTQFQITLSKSGRSGVQMRRPMIRMNVTGASLAKKRHEKGWTQDITAAKLQSRGADISRQMLANMECGRTEIKDKHLMAFQEVFEIAIVRFFPLNVQAREEQLLAREKEFSQKTKQRWR